MQLPVGQNPVQLFQLNALQEDVTLYNPGTSAVYVDTASSVSAASSLPINPQASLVWQKGRALWAVGTVGSSLIASDNGGQANDPGALAVALISAGLAQDIANDINATGVPITNSPDVNLAPGAAVDLNPGASVGISGGQLTVAGIASQPVVTQVPASYFGGGTDGSATIAGTVTLTRPKQYTALTVPVGTVLNEAGWPVYVSGIAQVDGVVSNDGAPGVTPTSGVSPGAGGAGGGAGVFPAGGAGGQGGQGNAAGAGTAGTAGAAPTVTNPNTVAGNSGAGGSGAVGGGAGASVTLPTALVPLDADLVTRTLGPGAGGGGGGGGSTSTNSGGGGGGGGGGVCVLIAATLQGTGTVQANGGNGGDCNHAAVSSAEGGGGAGGGGTAVAVYASTGTGWNGTQVVAAAGAVGIGHTAGTTNNGKAGQAGSTFAIQVKVAP